MWGHLWAPRRSRPLVGMSAQALPLTGRRVQRALPPSPLSDSFIDAHGAICQCVSHAWSPLETLWTQGPPRCGAVPAWAGRRSQCEMLIFVTTAVCLIFVSKGSIRASAWVLASPRRSLVSGHLLMALSVGGLRTETISFSILLCHSKISFLKMCFPDFVLMSVFSRGSLCSSSSSL